MGPAALVDVVDPPLDCVDVVAVVLLLLLLLPQPADRSDSTRAAPPKAASRECLTISPFYQASVEVVRPPRGFVSAAIEMLSGPNTTKQMVGQLVKHLVGRVLIVQECVAGAAGAFQVSLASGYLALMVQLPVWYRSG